MVDIFFIWLFLLGKRRRLCQACEALLLFSWLKSWDGFAQLFLCSLMWKTVALDWEQPITISMLIFVVGIFFWVLGPEFYHEGFKLFYIWMSNSIASYCTLDFIFGMDFGEWWLNCDIGFCYAELCFARQSDPKFSVLKKSDLWLQVWQLITRIRCDCLMEKKTRLIWLGQLDICYGYLYCVFSFC